MANEETQLHPEANLPFAGNEITHTRRKELLGVTPKYTLFLVRHTPHSYGILKLVSNGETEVSITLGHHYIISNTNIM